MSKTVRVRVPASSANLGPGFDAFGLALGWYDHVEATTTASGVHVEIDGEGAGRIPTDERHLVVRAIHAVFHKIGARPPGLSVTCINRIPHSRGLGSSAAALVAGVALGRSLAGNEKFTDDDALNLASELEGHPDNVAACLLGGGTLAWQNATEVRVIRLEVTNSIRPVVFVPPHRSSTKTARQALPDVVPHHDAAANAARAALLVEALRGRTDLLFDASEDWLHQRYRAAGIPESAALVARLRAAGIAAVVSGAGPSVLALTTADQEGSTDGHTPDGWTVHHLEVDRRGAQVDTP